ncbi:MAG: oxidoreductase, partial [Nitrospinaceae bacterium]|nr:oxidoreductase [Nitrospinaceae bacterium]NIS85323.1 oxidoreductase [Nitrospinaceae bacterium]NIU96527.1 oxidoreductase [Nitrospinaceae bacterium]
IIVCGDLNVLPRSKVYRKLRRRLKDTQLELPGHRPKRTFFGRYPVSRIDYIFVSPEITVHSVEVPRSALTRVASDHLPIVAELSIPKKPKPAGCWEAA